MDKLSKNHHYIPKTILRRFAFSGDSVLLFDGSTPELGFREKNIERTFQKFHLNTYVDADGNKDDAFERWLAREVDDPLAVALSFLEQNPGKVLADPHRLAIAKYFCVAIFRSPVAKNSVSSILKPSLDISSNLFDVAQDIFGFEDSFWIGRKPKDISEWINAALPIFLDDDSLLRFANGVNCVARAHPNGAVFCIGDFPFVRYDDPRIAIDGVAQEFWFVLSPKIAVSFVLNTNLPIDAIDLSLPDAYVRRLNHDLAMRSRYVVSNCPVAMVRAVRGLGRYPKERLLKETRIEEFLTT